MVFGLKNWRLFGASERKSGLSAPEQWLLDAWTGQPGAAGEAVSASTALRVPAVACAVGLISEAVGTLPVKAFVRGSDGAREAAPEHPAYGLVHDQANDWTSAGQLRIDLTRDALLHGSGFAYANRVQGRVIEFNRLDPATVTVETASDGSPRFKVQNGTEVAKLYSFPHILHISAPGGIAPVKAAAEAIGLALALEKHAAKLFANGARPSGVLKEPVRGNNQQPLRPDAIERMRNSWRQAHGGANSGGTAFLENGVDFQPLTFSSVDAQFEEMRRFQILEIARAFRTAPIFLQALEHSTFKNGEEMNRQFLTFTLMPWLRKWQDAYTRILLNEDERKTHFIEFIVDGLLQADTEKRADAIAKRRAAGVITANEARALDNLPPHRDGDKLENPYTTGANDNARRKDQAA